MSQDVLFQIADALARDGKEPSVALIKSRLPEPRPIPEIISALQRWRSQKAGSTQELPESAPQESTPLASMPAELAQWLTPMQQEIHQLRHEVAQLRQSLVQPLREKHE